MEQRDKALVCVKYGNLVSKAPQQFGITPPFGYTYVASVGRLIPDFRNHDSKNALDRRQDRKTLTLT